MFLAEYWNTPGAGVAPAIPTTAPAVSPARSRDRPRLGQTARRRPAIDADHFVARWTRTVSLAAGYYDFTTTADDGVRLSSTGTR